VWEGINYTTYTDQVLHLNSNLPYLHTWWKLIENLIFGFLVDSKMSRKKIKAKMFTEISNPAGKIF